VLCQLWLLITRFAKTNKYDVSATQELIATGYANVLGVICNGFFASGGLSRSAVNAESGAKSPMSGVISAVLITISLLCLTKLFYYIPMAVLGAIIMVSVQSMLDFDAFLYAYKNGQKRDSAVMCVTFFFTFFMGISQGIGVGVLLSVSTVLMTVSFPQMVTLGRVERRPARVFDLKQRVTAVTRTPSPSGDALSPASYCSPDSRGGSDVSTDIEAALISSVGSPWLFHYKNVVRHPHAQQLPGIAIVRMDASLFFANTQNFKKFILESAQGIHHNMGARYVPNKGRAHRVNEIGVTANVTPERIWLVIVDCSAWVDLDSAGINVLKELKEELRDKYDGCMLQFVHLIGPLRDILVRAGVYDLDMLAAEGMGDEDDFAAVGFDHIDDLVEAVKSMKAKRGQEKDRQESLDQSIVDTNHHDVVNALHSSPTPSSVDSSMPSTTTVDSVLAVGGNSSKSNKSEHSQVRETSPSVVGSELADPSPAHSRSQSTGNREYSLLVSEEM
jgi:MFS superfamily sulfate permease-like transporter